VHQGPALERLRNAAGPDPADIPQMTKGYRIRSFGGEWRDVEEVVPFIETETPFGGRDGASFDHLIGTSEQRR
jgi:hypothetical protein